MMWSDEEVYPYSLHIMPLPLDFLFVLFCLFVPNTYTYDFLKDSDECYNKPEKLSKPEAIIDSN